MANVVLNVVNIDQSGLRGLAERLLTGSALVRPSVESPFKKYGVLSAGPVLAKNRSAQETKFSVTVARARIADFADGSFRPNVLQELIDYLKERFLRLDSRTFADGRVVNYVTDLVTGQSVLAADVDKRLSRSGIARLFGRTLDAEAEARRRRIEMTPEMVEALALRSSNATRFRNDPREIPFSDWDDIRFTSSAMFDGREVTGQGNEIWVGFEVAKASASPEENLAVLGRLREQGFKVIVPAKTVADAKAGVLVAGMPILLREGAVRTRMIKEAFTADRMNSAFGESIYAHYEALARRAPVEDAAKEKVIRMADFKQMRRRDAAAQPVPAERKAAPASKDGRFTIRHELAERGRESLTVIDATTGREMPLSSTDLPAGRYVKEDAFGLASGYLAIKPDGGYVHEDMAGRHHNPFGPAIVPAEGSGERVGYALDGEFMDARDFRARNNTGSARDMLRREAESRSRQADEEAARVDRVEAGRDGVGYRIGR